MYRTTLVLLLLAATLPMVAKEGAGVTVHQAEWGDTRGEEPPPSGPSVPAKAPEPVLVFHQEGFRYGTSVRYRYGSNYGQSFRYAPGTRFSEGFRPSNSTYQPSMTYRGAGRLMNNGSYQPSIEYAPGIDQATRSSYGFGAR